MKLKYIDKESATHEMTFHENDLLEALQDAKYDGATEIEDLKTQMKYKLADDIAKTAQEIISGNN